MYSLYSICIVYVYGSIFDVVTSSDQVCQSRIELPRSWRVFDVPALKPGTEWPWIGSFFGSDPACGTASVDWWAALNCLELTKIWQIWSNAQSECVLMIIFLPWQSSSKWVINHHQRPERSVDLRVSTCDFFDWDVQLIFHGGNFPIGTSIAGNSLVFRSQIGWTDQTLDQVPTVPKKQHIKRTWSLDEKIVSSMFLWYLEIGGNATERQKTKPFQSRSLSSGGDFATLSCHPPGLSQIWCSSVSGKQHNSKTKLRFHAVPCLHLEVRPCWTKLG